MAPASSFSCELVGSSPIFDDRVQSRHIPDLPSVGRGAKIRHDVLPVKIWRLLLRLNE
jgi:hypothetical protein